MGDATDPPAALIVTRFTAGACEADGPTLSCPVAVVSTVAEASGLPTCRIRQQSLAWWPGRPQL